MHPLRIAFICFIVVIPLCRVNAQMPDWIGVRDREGNTYFFDSTGKVRTLGTPGVLQKPVSPVGIEFHIHQAEELMRNRHRVEALLMLKSIIAMPSTDYNVFRAQKRASEIINDMIKKEGTRYEETALEAFPVMFLDPEKNIVLGDERMRFSLTVKGHVEVIRKKTIRKAGYERRGLLLGIRVGEQDPGSPYDALVAIEAERYRAPVSSISDIRTHWDLAAGQGDIERKTVKNGENAVVDTFTFNGEITLRGFEGYFKSAQRGYFVKIISPASRFNDLEKDLLKIVDSFRVIPD